MTGNVNRRGKLRIYSSAWFHSMERIAKAKIFPVGLYRNEISADEIATIYCNKRFGILKQFHSVCNVRNHGSNGCLCL